MIKPVQSDLLKRFFRLSHLSGRSGSVPESLIFIGEDRQEIPLLTEYVFNDTALDIRSGVSTDQLRVSRDKGLKYWLNLDGLADTSLLERIGKAFNIHPLVLEDILNTGHIPKFEDYGDHLFITLKMLIPAHDEEDFDIEQVSLVLGPDVLISFQEKEGDVFSPVKERLAREQSRVRTRGIDYLLYSLVDVIVDNYYTVIDALGLEADELEDRVFDSADESSLQEIQEFKKRLLMVYKSVAPLREALMRFIRSETKLLDLDNTKYFNDVLDHLQHLIESIDTYRELIPGLRDIYLSNLSQQANKVMQVLTIIATIFIPLTFIAGVYGMNFDNMPELHTADGYFVVLGVMGVITVLLLLYFHRRRWL